MIPNREAAVETAILGARRPAVVLLAGKGCEEAQKRKNGPEPCIPDGTLARRALDKLSELRECEAHSSVILSPADSGTYAKLGMRLTCEPTYETNKLYHK